MIHFGANTVLSLAAKMSYSFKRLNSGCLWIAALRGARSMERGKQLPFRDFNLGKYKKAEGQLITYLLERTV